MKQEIVKQANIICRREWIITALGHNLVMCALAKYQEQGIKLEDMTKPCYVRIPVKKLLSGRKENDGGNQYQAIQRMLKQTWHNVVIFDRQNYLDVFPLFHGRASFDKDTGEIICSLNPELCKYWLEVTENYTLLQVDKVLQLPLNTTAHLLYQCLMSYKYKQQCELDYDDFKLELGYKKMANYDFTRRVLAKYKKEFTELDVLLWDYELVHGRCNKIVKIRIWFPEKAKAKKQTQEKKKDWGWISEQYPEAIEMAQEIVDLGKWQGALIHLDAILNSTPPDEREQTIKRFKSDINSLRNQQDLF